VSSGKFKILIVDDDADLREALSFFLQSHGYLVLKAADAREGLLLARLQRPDLMLMDLMMGERTEGMFAVQEMRQIPELREVPIFVISALYSRLPDFGIAPNRAWLGHDEFFPKPVDLDALLTAIRRRLTPPSTGPTPEERP